MRVLYLITYVISQICLAIGLYFGIVNLKSYILTKRKEKSVAEKDEITKGKYNIAFSAIYFIFTIFSAIALFVIASVLREGSFLSLASIVPILAIVIAMVFSKDGSFIYNSKWNLSKSLILGEGFLVLCLLAVAIYSLVL